MILNNEIVGTYGAGSAAAHAFARKTAKLYLAGRHRSSAEAVGEDGGSTAVDACDGPQAFAFGGLQGL